LQGDDEKAAQNVRQVLCWVLTKTLALLHPFMPYLTEEIWQSLPHEGEALVVAEYPQYDKNLSFPTEAAQMEIVMDAVRAIRNRRSEMNVPPSRKAKLYIATAQKAEFEAGTKVFERLASASSIEISDSFDLAGAVTIVTSHAKIYIEMDELVDRKAEVSRLKKELETVTKGYNSAKAKLNNEKFMQKAPQNVIDGVRDNMEKLEKRMILIQSSLSALE
jgi:valyl-tRNA synthetase